MKKKYILIFFFLIFFSFPFPKGCGWAAFSQCCSPGNPVGGDANQGVLNKNSFRTIVFFKNSVSNNYFEGNKKSDAASFIDKGTFNFSGITLAYGVLKRFTLETELGYFISKKQVYNTSFGIQELIGSGFSDLAFIGKYKIFSKPENQFEFTTGGGYKIPLGPYQQRNENGILLPIDIQPTSGAYGYIGSLFLYRGFIEKKLHFFLTSRVQFTPDAVKFTEIIPTKYYRFGNFFATSFFTSFSIFHRWNFIVQVRHELRTQDKYKFEGNPSYRIYESSGGQKIFVVPQLIFEIQQGFIASAMFDYPVYQYYNQKQLATAYAGTITLSRVFNFNKPQKNIKNENRENQ